MRCSLELQVPLWTVDDVACWVRQIGFESELPAFVEAGVDGDLLLQLDEANVKDDICIKNGIHRKRFLRELATLKRTANYSSMDNSDLAGFLASKVGAEYRAYTYGLLKNDLCLELMQRLGEADLSDMLEEAGVKMAIHRHRIIEAIAREDCANAEDDEVAHFLSQRTSSGSSLASSTRSPHYLNGGGVYVTYPRALCKGSNCGAELASLISLHLQEYRGLPVYSTSDANHSNAEDALRHLREAKTFVVVLPRDGLRDVTAAGGCKGNNLLHREIVTALQSGCNIVPVLDGFAFPEAEELPEDVRALSHFNGVKWVHDYQEACIDKIERFIRGEPFSRAESVSRLSMSGGGGCYSKPASVSGRSTPVKMLTPVSGRRRSVSVRSTDSALSRSACF